MSTSFWRCFTAVRVVSSFVFMCLLTSFSRVWAAASIAFGKRALSVA